MGMPGLEPDWSADQRSTARLILHQVAERDPAQLPRFLSERSGALFEKLVHEEFVRRGYLEGPIGKMTGPELDSLTPDALAQMVHQDTLESIYTPESTGGLLFDRELVEMTAQRLAAALRLRAEIETSHREAQAHSTADLDDEIESKYHELSQASDSILLLPLSQLAEFAIAERCSPAARADATSHLVQQVPQVTTFMSPDHLTQLHGILEDARAAPEADPRLSALADTW